MQASSGPRGKTRTRISRAPELNAVHTLMLRTERGIVPVGLYRPQRARGGRRSRDAVGAGAMLAAQEQVGIRLISATGGVIRTLTVPGAGGGCFPSRWWSPAIILASCHATAHSRGRLWLVPADGAKPTPLTALLPGPGVSAPGVCLAACMSRRPVPRVEGASCGRHQMDHSRP